MPEPELMLEPEFKRHFDFIREFDRYAELSFRCPSCQVPDRVWFRGGHILTGVPSPGPQRGPKWQSQKPKLTLSETKIDTLCNFFLGSAAVGAALLE